MVFIDYEKAFDSVSTVALLEALKDQGIEETCIRLLHEIYKECMGRIILHKKSNKFQIRKGLRKIPSRQNYSQYVWRGYSESLTGLRINGEYLRHLRLADDIVLLSVCGTSAKTA